MLDTLRTKELPELAHDQTLVAGWKQRVPELIQLDDATLLATMRSLVPIGLELFVRHLDVTGRAGAAVQFLASVCEKRVGDGDRALALLSSLGDVDSAAPSRALWKLGRTVQASPEVTGPVWGPRAKRMGVRVADLGNRATTAARLD